uniref:Uncharacterized protein n=1 Tax=Lygus hesperus TaxID=30085 RepID=A0A0A9Z4X8_LYGHE
MLIDQIILNHNRKVLETEQAAIRDERAQNWNELVIFKHAMVEYRNAWKERAQETERLVNEYAREIELKKHKVRKARETSSKDLAMACFKADKLKAAENIAKQATSNQMESKARELVEHYNSVNNRLSSAAEKEKLMELNPGPYNDESLKYLKLLQERQQLEDREMLENMKRQNDVHQREVMTVLERPIQESYKHQHPMYRVLKSE